MKRTKLYAAASTLFLMMVTMLSLPAVAQFNSVKGQGEVVSRNQNVSGFKGIDVGGGFAVELTQGNKEEVRIEAQENLQDHIVTEVRNGVLYIHTKGSISTNKGLKAYVTVRELNMVSISGGVKLTGNSNFKSNAFKLDLSGGSKVALNITTKKLSADMSGASKVELKGRADEMIMDLSGASVVDATELEAKNVNIGASGASKVKVYAREKLDINASGASKVEYKGSPAITSDVSAAAKISKM